MAKKGRKFIIKDNTKGTKDFSHLATAYDDTVTMYGQNNFIDTGKGNDKIYIKKKGVGINLHAWAGAGNDTIIIYKKTKYAAVSGVAGNDKLTIKGGENNHAIGGAGNDTICITGGTGNWAEGEKGHNKIYIQGGRAHYAEGGLGNDTISLDKGDKMRVYGSSGSDKIYVNDGNGHVIDGGDKKDYIYVYYGKDHTVFGGTGNDVIKVMKNKKTETTPGSGINVCGGAGNDTITVSAGTGIWVKSDYDHGKDYVGNDSITVKSSSTKIQGGAGNDTISVTGGSGNTVYSSEGSNTIYIKGGKGHTVEASSTDGNKIIVSKGTDNTINMYGTGSVTLTGGTSKLMLSFFSYNDPSVTVSAVNGAVVNKKLYVEGRSWTSCCFKQSKNDLLIADHSGATPYLTAKDFFAANSAFSNGISFDDKDMSVQDVINALK